ncbi:MAG TPA: site-specific integrase [Microvirga sp.]|jgi:integrase|nr:site-specific integrase [Microvirga sp.]
MSVYKPKGSQVYRYDFWLDKQRFSGSTECRAKSDAREYERQVKQKARDYFREQSQSHSAPLTIDLAADKFWEQRGQYYRGNARKTFKAALKWIVLNAGPHRLLSAFNNGVVAELVARRRGEGVSNATVNRTVTEPLRRIMFCARDEWDHPIPNINWKKHLLSEPQERVRELKDEEEAALFGRLRADYHDIVVFALMTGCRLHECVNLKWENVDWGARKIWINGKGGTLDPIPLPPSVRDLLWPLQGHHPESVFTYVAGRTRSGRRKGERHPITYEGLKTVFRRTTDGLLEGYRFHDNRHTAATRVLRATGNVRVVKEMLRHADITTTMKYAHVMHDDVLDAMEKAARRPATAPAPVEVKNAKG